MKAMNPINSTCFREVEEYYRNHPDVRKELAGSGDTVFREWLRDLYWHRELLELLEYARSSGKTVAIWGTGARADIIMEYYVLPGDNLMIVDGRSGAGGGLYRGLKVHPPEELAERETAGVVLAVGKDFIPEVEERLSELPPRQMKVVRLHTEEDWQPDPASLDPGNWRLRDLGGTFDPTLPLNRWPPVLFVQEEACMRSYKMGKVLSGAGLRVDLAYFGFSHQERYGLDDSFFRLRHKLRAPHELIQILPRYKLVHCHNLPDRATYFSALFHPAVIQDVHDAASMKDHRPDWLALEREIFNLVAGYVFISGYQLEFAEALHGSMNRPTLLLPNYALAEAVPERQMPKLSADNKGETHLCLVSGVRAAANYRNLLGLIERLAGDGLHLHLHVPEEAPAYRALAERLEYFHYYPPLPYHELLKTLTRYDAGLIWYDYSAPYLEHLHATLPNRLFDYLAAGLPVITGPYRSSMDFVLRHNAGLVVSSENEIPVAAHKTKGLKIDGGKFVMEAHLEELVDFYRNVLAHSIKDRIRD